MRAIRSGKYGKIHKTISKEVAITFGKNFLGILF
jgi:hypothetical protein